jgi:HK97 family phage portal protein
MNGANFGHAPPRPRSKFRQKAFEIYRGLFDFPTGAVRSGFFPAQIGGIAAPPVNIVGTADGKTLTPKRTLELSTAWACCWLIADTIASLPFCLNEKVGTNTWGTPAQGNPLYTVLGRKPNALQSAVDFWAYQIASLQLWGNGYSVINRNKAGDCISLDPLLPQFMIPYKDPDTGLIRYRYLPAGANDQNDPQQDYLGTDIFHLRDHSIDGLIGLSRIEFARNSFGIALAGEQSTADIFRNGMRTNGFLMYDKVLKPEQRVEVKGSLARFKAGGPEAAGFMVLEGGMTFEALSMSPLDAQLLAQRQFAVEEICRWFGVPPIFIGHGQAGVTSYGTGIEQLLLGFISLTLRPTIRKIEQTVNRSLIKPGDAGTTYLSIDTDDLQGADSAARQALYASAGQNGWMTRNEIRGKEDLPPMPGGDVLTVQSNLIPIDKLGQAQAGQGSADPADAPESDKPPPNQPPPKGARLPRYLQ